MSKTKRTDRIDFKLTPSERQAAERLAEVEGRTLSEAAREALRFACERRGILPAGAMLKMSEGSPAGSVSV